MVSSADHDVTCLFRHFIEVNIFYNAFLRRSSITTGFGIGTPVLDPNTEVKVDDSRETNFIVGS